MAIQTWFTQPAHNAFSSFYMYDTVTEDFVRIRLELNRASHGHDNGDTKIIKRSNRKVAFSANLDSRAFLDANHIINILGVPVLYTYPPIAGQRVYDCSVGGPIHFGNFVTFTPNLPVGIDTMILHTIARHYITGNDVTVNLTPSNGNGLVAALNAEHNNAV